MVLSPDLHLMEARAERAEALVEALRLEVKSLTAEVQAQKSYAAEREVALDERGDRYRNRAVAAEARVKELETENARYAEASAKHLDIEGAANIRYLNERDARLELESRVAELQALVGAAIRFEFGDVDAIRIAGPTSSWWVCPRGKEHERIDTRDEAIALARELAAKGSER